MVKFLSGGQFDGGRVPLCTFWRADLRTDPSKEVSEIEGTGLPNPQADAGQNSSIGDFPGQCIANAFFPKSTITCFNDGNCNGSGKCLPCSRYQYGGMKMAITHSPPVEVLRFFNKGLSEEDIKSPNLVSFPPSAAQATEQTQLPFHVLIRNIQAEVAKCCHWNADTGIPGKFFLATIRNGPDSRQITDADGNVSTVQGVLVQNEAFPDEVGTFFPVGTTVVAGWEDQPSFFLEPRTGLVRSGDGIIYSFTSGEGVSETPSSIRTKQIASDSNDVVTNAVNAAIFACQAAQSAVSQNSAFFNNALNTNDPQTIAAAQAKLDEANANATVACDAATDAPDVGQDCIDLIADTIQSGDTETLQANGQALADKLDELADLVEAAAGVVAGSAATEAANQVRLLRINARTLRFSSNGGFTRCEFFFEETNIARVWNAPDDGSLPCNGVRTDCVFYTGTPWTHATDELMEIGRPVLAEQIQEVRFRSENWARFADPEEEFRNRFTTPFIWAFKDYVDVSGEPDPSDPNQMLLFKPKVLFGRGGAFSGYQQIRMDRVEITDLTAKEFSVSKSQSLTNPGSETLDKDQAPSFPSLISQPTVPTATRLAITHPDPSSSPFIYRMWTPEKNKITLFGTASPEQTIYIINRTALRNRDRYLQRFGERNFFELPTDLPKAPNFTGLTGTELLDIVEVLGNEKTTNSNTTSPLGFHELISGRDGFWESIQEVDLVHNEINEIYAFLIAGENNVLVSRTLVDCRFLHSIVGQTGFTGKDFTILDIGGSNSKLGTNVDDTAQVGTITAEAFQLIGQSRETVSFDYLYYAWRFIDRGLGFGTLNADNDLQGQNPIADQASTLIVTEASPSEFVVNVGYHVVEYQLEDQLVEDWSLIGDCGTILIRIADPNVHRVLPLPNQEGSQTPLQGILLNGGGTGSEVAQWGLTKATLTTTDVDGTTVEKELVQFYRDTDGFGLPANYVVLGPGPGVDDQFGRPDPEVDEIRISYKFLRAQSAAQEGDAPVEGASSPQEATPVVENAIPINTNFHNDNLRRHKHSISAEGNSFVFGGSALSSGQEGGVRISDDQQDYVFVFRDNEGRPIGKKYMRFYVMYYNLSCINVEIFYRWAATCTTYALIPDLNTRIGDAGGTVTLAPDATDDPQDDRLSLGFRIKNLLGDRDCTHQPNCGDHEFIRLGPLRKEFEVIVRIAEEDDDGETTTFLKANFPSAGGPIEGEIISAEPPGSQFLKRHGPMWYPYTACERPRYQFNTNGPLNTDSTELINTTVVNPGLPSDAVVTVGPGGALSTGQSGQFGALPDPSCEAYQGPNQVVAKILDVHPSLRPCTSEYTYGNQVLKSGENRFAGYARRRGIINIFLYEGLGWTSPPFGNFGRSRLVFELSSERGDYLTSNQLVARRWMPMFPTRPNLGATTGQFSEDALEHAAYRMLCEATPVGTIGESVPTASVDGTLTILGVPRFTHKDILGNKTAGAIEFPFSPYFPMFLPDGITGQGGNVPLPEGGSLGPITTMWAWREAEKTVQRGVSGSSILRGISLQNPDYFIDNRRLEVRLRPEEGSYILTWTPPTYNLEDGTVNTNGFLQLGLDGPPREVVIDFVNRTFGVADQDDSVYDTSLALGEGDIPCEIGPSDNPNMGPQCSCITDIDDPSLGAETDLLPSRFLHLDELAPAGYTALYESPVPTNLPFLIDIPRTTNEEPCCMCVHYIPGIFFQLNGTYLPAVSDINPAFDSRLEPTYTWSRVPHGLGGNVGVDGAFNGFEQQADDTLLDFSSGEVFTNFIENNLGSMDPAIVGGAIFPAPTLATTRIADDDPILVGGALDPGDPVELAKLKGGIPATEDNESQGQPEPITLTMLFNTYVRITDVIVVFYAGRGYEAPKYTLNLVPPANRNPAQLTTLHTGIRIGESLESAFEGNIPNSNQLDPEDVANGQAKFVSRLNPTYSRLPFWESYGMEWQLVFPQRGQAQSLGIASIQVKVDALTEGSENTEVVGIRERKYYKSQGSPTNGNNPERFLEELDSATAYWRSTDLGPAQGDNRHRAYAWGSQITDDQPPIRTNDIAQLESLQGEEYDNARSLLPAPYQYRFTSFLPFDEQAWLELFGDSEPTWISTLSVEISEVDKIITPSNSQPLHGVIPTRKTFNAPGHVWVHNFEETYTPCCIGCVHSMIVNYDFLHLHDNLALVETAGFWSELPSGFTRLIRSTIMLPDPTFQGGAAGVGNTVLIDESAFIDSQGNAIPTEVLNAAGFTQDPTTGQYYVDGSEPNAGVGGPAGPEPNCGV